MKNVEIKPNIYWVGAVDWAIRDFHGYITPRGSTYNNYLIMDSDITLVDTVHAEHTGDTIRNIRRLTEFGKIKNIVVNHIESDHAGGLVSIKLLAPDAVVYCTDKAKKGLARMFDISGWDIRVVKSGDTLSTGTKTLTFLETPMLHWPDSMMTYIKEDRLLISQDAFGQHLASAQRFDDEFVGCASMEVLEDAVWDYYANSLMPFGSLILNKLAEVEKLGLEIDMIAPDHGIIWRAHPGKILKMYADIASGYAEERVVVIYDTMWHSTEKMARPIADGIKAESMDVRVFKLRSTSTSEAMKEMWRARGCLIGSPTLNNTVFPEVGKFLDTMRGLRPKNRIVGAFGSCGWAGGAIKEILDDAKGLKLEVVEPGLQIISAPSSEDEETCFEFGRDFARKTREYHKNFAR